MYHKQCRFVNNEDGRQGRTRTYVVSNVPGLQPGAFAAQRHLTIALCFARMAGLEPATTALTVRRSTIELHASKAQILVYYTCGILLNLLNERATVSRVGLDPTSPQSVGSRVCWLPSNLLPVVKERRGFF